MNRRVVQAEEIRLEYRRRARDLELEKAPLCPVCGTALHPYLTNIKLTVHPCCGPEPSR